MKYIWFPCHFTILRLPRVIMWINLHLQFNLKAENSSDESVIVGCLLSVSSEALEKQRCDVMTT